MNGARGLEARSAGSISFEGRVDNKGFVMLERGRVVLTERGASVHELVRKQGMVNAHLDPNISSAMSPQMLNDYLTRIAELDEILNMPKDQQGRNRRLRTYKRDLIRSGAPPWRINL